MQFRAPMRTPASPNAAIIAALVQQIELTSIVGAERDKKQAYANSSAYVRCLAVLRAWPAPLFDDDEPAKGVDEEQLALFGAAQYVGPSAVKRIRQLAGRNGAIKKVKLVLENDTRPDIFEVGCHLELRAHLAAVHGLGHRTVLKMVKCWPPAIGLTRFAAAPDPVHFFAALVARDGALRAAAEQGVALSPAPGLDVDVAALRAVERGPLSLINADTKKGLEYHAAFQEGISPGEVACVLAEVSAVLRDHAEVEGWALEPDVEVVGSRRRQPNRESGRKDLDILMTCKAQGPASHAFGAPWPPPCADEIERIARLNYDLVEAQMELLLCALKKRGVLKVLMKEGSSSYTTTRGTGHTTSVNHCVKLAVFSLPAAGVAGAGRVFRRVDIVVVPHYDKVSSVHFHRDISYETFSQFLIRCP